MIIEDKLALSRRPGVISFIREGMFYRCYQQSLFFYLTQCDGKIKILGKRIKKLGGEAVFYGGFPMTQFEQRYPQAELTGWGAEIQGDWSDRDYVLWYEECVNSLLSEIATAPQDDVDPFVLTQQMRHFCSLGSRDAIRLRWSPVSFRD